VKHEPNIAVHRRQTDWWMFAVAAIAAGCIFYRLGSPPIYWWDEARAATSSLEMLRHPGLVVTFHDEPDLWNTKPPTLIWLNALSMAMFGANEWALRLPSGLAAVGTVIAVYLFTRRNADQRTGFLAALMLLGCGGFMDLHVARTADYDSPLVFLMTLATFSLFFGFERQRFGLPAASTAAAMLTKGVAGATMIPGYGLYTLIYRREALRSAVIPALAGFAVVAAFYVVRELIQPGYLAAVWQWDFHRFGVVSEGHSGRHKAGYLLGLILTPELSKPYSTSAFPWIIVAPFALVRPTQATKYLACCLIPFFMIASLSATKLPWYVVPAFPLIAVMAATASRKWFWLVLPMAIGMAAYNMARVEIMVEKAPEWSASSTPPPVPKVVNGVVVGTELYDGPASFYRERAR
jgi:4-amino-4-deoxy-L-arabinose transferase-like glycosyltransferase